MTDPIKLVPSKLEDVLEKQNTQMIVLSILLYMNVVFARKIRKKMFWNLCIEMYKQLIV